MTMPEALPHLIAASVFDNSLLQVSIDDPMLSWFPAVCTARPFWVFPVHVFLSQEAWTGVLDSQNLSPAARAWASPMCFPHAVSGTAGG